MNSYPMIENRLNTRATQDATPEEFKQWQETDYFVKGEFSAMQMFVVIPAVVQIIVFGTMLGAFAIISVLF
jgi:hypothetical protein